MWQAIDKNAELKPGDELRLELQIAGYTWLQAAQLALIESRLEKQYPLWEIMGFGQNPDSPDKMYFRIRVKNDPELPAIQQAGIITPAVIIAVIIGVVAPIVYYFTVTGVFKKIEESPAAQAVTIGGIGVAGLVLIYLLLGSKK
jgi:hypothetical protein